MKDKRRELRKKHNEICRNIMNETDASDIKKLQAERERIEKKIKQTEGGSGVKDKKRQKRDIGNCLLCYRRIKYGEPYVESNKRIFCKERHLNEYIALKNEK
ncbi:hypothetical protein [Paenibacillus sp. FSL K6-1558]|uniref:hypothetical protein n=1 Tax=Paenibacillus sp. FSL K6-1558 TaxID=2921473 RepID=UPI0030F9742A